MKKAEESLNPRSPLIDALQRAAVSSKKTAAKTRQQNQLYIRRLNLKIRFYKRARISTRLL